MEQGWPGLAQYIPSNPADWNPRPRTVQDALDTLAAGGSAVAAADMFVWQPGGAAGQPHVYTTLATLEAALQDVAGPKIIGVDTSHSGGVATIDTTGMPAGGWRLNDTTWMPCLATTAVVITISEGAKFAASVLNLSLVRTEMVGANTATTIWTPVPGAAFLTLESSFWGTTAAGAFLDVGAGGVLEILAKDGSALVSDGTHPAIKVEAAGSLSLALVTGSELEPNVIGQGTAPGGAVAISLDGSCQGIASKTQGAGPVYAYRVDDPLSVFVFKPGATQPQNLNVFTVWDDMMRAVDFLNGAPWKCFVDDSLAAAHVTTVGAGAPWNIDQGTFVSAINQTAVAGATLIFDAGAKITFSQIWLDGGITFQQPNTATAPVFALAAPAVVAAINIIGQGSNIQALGAQPFATADNACFLSVDVGGVASFIGDGTHNAINALAGGTIVANIMCAGAPAAAAHAFGGAGTLTYNYLEASEAPATQDTTTQTFIYYGISNTVSATGNTGTGGSPITVTTGNIKKQKTGKMRVSATCALSTSAACTLTIQLVRDAATNIGTAKTLVAGAAVNALDISIATIDTAPDAANHTYKLSVTASAGNITVGANSAQIQVVED